MLLLLAQMALAAPALDYKAPEACPEVGMFVDEVSARVGRLAFSRDAPEIATVRIGSTGSSWWGSITIGAGIKNAEASSCQEVFDALVATAAVALDAPGDPAPASALEEPSEEHPEGAPSKWAQKWLDSVGRFATNQAVFECMREASHEETTLTSGDTGLHYNRGMRVDSTLYEACMYARGYTRVKREPPSPPAGGSLMLGLGGHVGGSFAVERVQTSSSDGFDGSNELAWSPAVPYWSLEAGAALTRLIGVQGHFGLRTSRNAYDCSGECSGSVDLTFDSLTPFVSVGPSARFPSGISNIRLSTKIASTSRFPHQTSEQVRSSAPRKATNASGSTRSGGTGMTVKPP